MADIVQATLHGVLGVESSPGTPVVGTKQMLSFGFERPKPMGEGQKLTPQGYKVPTTVVPVGRRWAEGGINGVLDFNEITYVLASLLNYQAPTTEGINGKHWVFSPLAAAVETRKYYTLEHGNNQHAVQVPYTFFNSLKIDMSPLAQSISGNYMGAALVDDITQATSPTILTQQVVPPQNFAVAIGSTRAALIGTQQVETATAAGSITGSGNATVVVTAAGMTNSPKTVSVAVTNGDTAATWAGKVRTALAADIDVASFFVISGSSTSIVLTTRAAAANDSSMNISLDNGTCTGITTAATSANTTAGVAAASAFSRPFSVSLDIPNVMDVIFRMNASDTSFINALDIPIAPILTFRTDADDAGMAYLANWTAGSQTFISVTANGNTISGSNATYSMRLMASCRLTKPYNPVEDRGNAQAEWAMDLVWDSTSSMLMQIDLLNTLSDIS